jgi:uncharacterized protein (TIGR02646 family)
MIRIRKSLVAPAGLARKGYGADSVQAAILADQDDKCYLCERQRDTDFQIEHLQCRDNYPEKMNCWENLFVACAYCNQKKSDSFDDICNPTTTNVECDIVQKIDFCAKKVVFKARLADCVLEKTAELLTRLYNGTKPGLRTTREDRFYKTFVQQMNVFRQAVVRYMECGDNETEIRQMLDIKAENLGFKYSILAETPSLMDKFKDSVKWNRV